MPSDPAYACGNFLNRDHQGIGQQHGPSHDETELGSRLAISSNAGWIVVRRTGDQSGAKSRENVPFGCRFVFRIVLARHHPPFVDGRMLGSEAIEQARSFLKESSVESYYEEIILKALNLAEADAVLGRLDDVRLENIYRTVSEIIEDLGSHPHQGDKKLAKDSKPRPSSVVHVEARKFSESVFCVPGLGRLDDCAALVLADFLMRRGVPARTAAAAAIQADAVDTICVCFLEEITEARADYAVRKFTRQVPSAKIIVCLLGATAGSQVAKAPSSDAWSGSLMDVLSAIEQRSASRSACTNRLLQEAHPAQ
jgi:hypothetical protein